MQQFKFHTERLRASGLRPTKQRLALCKILFDRKDTFHFTIEKLKQIAARDSKRKISLATVYNNLNHFKKISSVQSKSTNIDLVTIADLESEKFIVNEISTSFPDHERGM